MKNAPFLILIAALSSAGAMAAPPTRTLESQAQAAGRDWCNEVSDADAALGATPGTIIVSGPGKGACSAAPALGNYHSLLFNKAGIYQISTGWTISGKHDFSITCVPGTAISFSGKAGFVIDGSMITNGARRIRIDGCIFSGNSYIAAAITLNKVVESTFTDLSGMNATDSAILCKGCLADTFIRPASSHNNNLGPGSHSVIPMVGLRLDTNGPIQSNVNTIIGPVFEGLRQGTGISCVSGSGNVIIGGTSEGNAVGLSFEKGCFENQVSSIDLEVNTRAAIENNGARNSFFNVTAYSSQANIVKIGSTAIETRFIGGTFHTITIAPEAHGTVFIGVDYSAAGKGGTIDNSSSNTVKLNVRNASTGAYDATQLGGGSVVVGSSTFANMPKAPNGSLIFCSDCNSSCTAGSATGRVCFRENGVWTH